MNSIFKIVAATWLMLLPVTTFAADDLSQILVMMDRRVGGECEFRKLMSQYQGARDPAEQRALQQRMNEVNKRRDDAERNFQGKNFEAMAQALPKADQLKIREYSIALMQRCNATLPPDARILLP